MPANEDKSFKALGVIFVCALLLFGALAGLKLIKKNGPEVDTPGDETQSRLAVKPKAIVDYDNLEKDKDLKAL